MQLELKSLFLFLDSYFSHPIWKMLDEPAAWIRIAYARSEKQKDELVKANKLSLDERERLGWFICSKIYSAQDFGTLENPGQAVKDIHFFNSRGSHCYFYPSISPKDLQFTGYRQLRDENITNVTFLSLDYDYSLPFGIKKLFNFEQPSDDKPANISQFNLTPILISRTSKVSNASRYQILIAVDPVISRDLDTLTQLAKTTSNALCADPSVSNSATLLRLPGTYNWKGAEKGAHAGYCRVIKTQPEWGYPVYNDEEIAAAVKNFLPSPLRGQLQQMRPVKKPILDDSEHTTHNRLFNIPWKKAYLAAKRGKITAHSGERHNALISWAGELSNDVTNGQYSKEEALRGISFLAEKACERFSASEFKSEVKLVSDFFLQCLAKDRKLHEDNLKELFAELEDSSAYSTNGVVSDGGVESVTNSANDPQQPQINNEDDSSENNIHTIDRATSDSDFWGNSISLWISYFCNPTKKERQELARLKRGEIVETECNYLLMLGDWLLGIYALKNSSGDTKVVVDVILNRINSIGAVHGPMICSPATSKNLWGNTVKFLVPLVDNKQRAFFFNYTIQYLTEAVKLWRDNLKRLPMINDHLHKIRERCEDDSRRVNSDGEETVDQKGLAKKVAAEIDKFFNPSVSYSTKHGWIKELEEGAHACAITQPQNLSGNTQIIFQNGVYNILNGEFIYDKTAWSRHVNAIWSDFKLDEVFNSQLDPKVEGNNKCLEFLRDTAVSLNIFNFGSQIKNAAVSPKNGSGGEGSGNLVSSKFNVFGDNGVVFDAVFVRDLLECSCPKFFKFLSDTFPGDYETWPIILSIIGYCLLPDNPFQICFNFHGITKTGKTTLASLICGLCGSSSSVSIDYGSFSKEYEGLIRAVGKNIVFVDEAEGGSKRNHELVLTALKRVTSNKPVAVRGIYKASIEARIYAKILMTTNRAIEFEDTSGALQRRMIVLEFENPARREVPDLERIILQSEANMIATIAALTLSSRWKLGREMFENNQSQARVRGRQELTSAVDGVSYALEQVFELTDKKEECLPLSFIAAVIVNYLEVNGVEIEAGFSNNSKIYKDITASLKTRGILGVERGRVTTAANEHARLYIAYGIRVKKDYRKNELPAQSVRILDYVREVSSSSHAEGLFKWCKNYFKRIL